MQTACFSEFLGPQNKASTSRRVEKKENHRADALKIGKLSSQHAGNLPESMEIVVSAFQKCCISREKLKSLISDSKILLFFFVKNGQFWVLPRQIEQVAVAGL